MNNWIQRAFDWLVDYLSGVKPAPALAPAGPTAELPTIPAIATSTPATPAISQNLKPQTPLLDLFCAEIRAMEGWGPGTTSYTHNNPGNLRCTPGMKQTWNSLATGQSGGFCIFPDAATGMRALRNVTISCCQGKSAVYNTAAKRFGLTSGADLNLYQYFEIRDPGTDGNDPKALAERFGRALGVNPATFTMRHLL
jgi:hypothetical protein